MTAREYHETTKHHFNRFARSAGHLDWASQPDPFRRFAEAPLMELPRHAVATAVPYRALFDGSAPALPVTAGTVSELLRCSMGLSAWKQYQASRWALRVNPSSGNLHPTEAYLVWNGRVHHYAPREHALEERCVFDPRVAAWSAAADDARVDDDWLLVGLTSIFWREAWKYGERAFRYCQHDLGHALGALRLSAARLGWTCRLMTHWSDAEVAALLGVDRDEDFVEAEREAAECVLLVTGAAAGVPGSTQHRVALDDLATQVSRGAWRGRANRLSRSHVDWPVIDDVASATVSAAPAAESAGRVPLDPPENKEDASTGEGPSARAIILQRRSAVAFDARSALPADTFLSMLGRLSSRRPPWDLWPWPPQVHLAIFVHRVDGLTPGIYGFLRDPAVLDEWRTATRPQFLWEPVADADRLGGGALFLLLPFDMMWPAMRVSCDQDIAGDGFFSLGMLAPLRTSIGEHGEWFYRRLFWEAGLIGQVLYLEAEAAGARATGIGCYYDDAVHELLGFEPSNPESPAPNPDHRRGNWQSLYHFSMGQPVDDTRLTTAPGYSWEAQESEEQESGVRNQESGLG